MATLNIRHIARFLQEQYGTEVCARFCANVQRDSVSTLSQAFNWWNSPEGDSFWRTIYRTHKNPSIDSPIHQKPFDEAQFNNLALKGKIYQLNPVDPSILNNGNKDEPITEPTEEVVEEDLDSMCLSFEEGIIRKMEEEAKMFRENKELQQEVLRLAEEAKHKIAKKLSDKLGKELIDMMQ